MTFSSFILMGLKSALAGYKTVSASSSLPVAWTGVHLIKDRIQYERSVVGWTNWYLVVGGIRRSGKTQLISRIHGKNFDLLIYRPTSVNKPQFVQRSDSVWISKSSGIPRIFVLAIQHQFDRSGESIVETQKDIALLPSDSKIIFTWAINDGNELSYTYELKQENNSDEINLIPDVKSPLFVRNLTYFTKFLEAIQLRAEARNRNMSVLVLSTQCDRWLKSIPSNMPEVLNPFIDQFKMVAEKYNRINCIYGIGYLDPNNDGEGDAMLSRYLEILFTQQDGSAAPPLRGFRQKLISTLPGILPLMLIR